VRKKDEELKRSAPAVAAPLAKSGSAKTSARTGPPMKGTIEMSAVTKEWKTEMKGTTATMKSPREDDDESQPTQEEHEVLIPIRELTDLQTHRPAECIPAAEMSF